ncbi:hypothetical protein FMGBMHLM_4476 [Methylobacterium aerolatum]|nr:hypothetical protein FMGBMHLM_4476 [Methylobacterium aerolatum]
MERWAKSAVDADYRIVADTGSTDDTVPLLRELGVNVYNIAVRPWRFDDARNAAMALIPSDVDICCTMDMDRWLEPDWRNKLETAWESDTTALFCRTAYKTDEKSSNELRSWPTKNFHSRWGYRFRRPVHEALVYTGDREKEVSCLDLTMYEAQDLTKSTRRQYLPLMQLAQKEDPSDPQICFWLARELMWAGQDLQSAEMFKNYLLLPKSTWCDERAEAMRHLANISGENRHHWLDKARQEAPYRREIWRDLAEYYHDQQDWLNLFWACTNGIDRTRRTGSYLDEEWAWNFRLYDLGAIAAWRLNVMERAVEWGKQALDRDPDNGRLKANLAFFLRKRDGFDDSSVSSS